MTISRPFFNLLAPINPMQSLPSKTMTLVPTRPITISPPATKTATILTTITTAKTAVFGSPVALATHWYCLGCACWLDFFALAVFSSSSSSATIGQDGRENLLRGRFAPVFVYIHIPYTEPIFYSYESVPTIVASESHDSLTGIIIRTMQITRKLGSQIPIITSAVDEMIGINARTGEVKEDYCVYLKPVLVLMDNNMPMETVVVGDASASFLFNSGNYFQNYQANLYSIDAVTLVFAKDSSSDVGGQIQFQLRQANGLLPFGPQLKMIGNLFKTFVQQRLLTIILVSILGSRTRINRNSQLGSRSYVAFYKKAIREAGNYGFVVDGVGIKPSGPFVFYHTDAITAFSSMNHAY
ncbi:hypothetical protein LWI28_016300 [Acer negundo]|uniref:Uncharacterized protein n=1 Tax=Acer negundo TaxID=4023 RepID=A0AAD5IZR5_ACENE|nr:hypothetical protein LWI28_016300 [Acer negundo]